MISTTLSGSGWLLVIATSQQQYSQTTTYHASPRRRTTFQKYWTGSEWSSDVAQAQSFKNQHDALHYLETHRAEMEKLL